MPSPPLSGRQRDALMEHLDSLYALAQVVTSDAEQAVQLVEATYHRAFTHHLADPSQETQQPSESPDFDSAEQARMWLFHQMMRIRNEKSEELLSDSGISQKVRTDSGNDLADLRRRLAEEFIDKALPPAFATLPSEQRMLLMLCDVERMSCEHAGRVLDLDPSVSCARLEEAHVSLHNALYANATDVERHLLETGLPPNWKRAALHRMTESRLVAVPPTLRPSVVSIFKEITQPDSGSAVSTMQEDDADDNAAATSPWPGLLKKAAAMLTIIVVAGLLGYGFTHLTRQEPDLDLISLSARQAESIEAQFQTTSAEQAERYIYDRLNTRVTLPSIAEAALLGVSIRSVIEHAEVPVVLFQDAATELPITVYVYSYAFLDRHQKELVLERDILRQIEAEGNFDLHDLGEEKALVWRNRDDIFIAITGGDAEELRSRIAYPS